MEDAAVFYNREGKSFYLVGSKAPDKIILKDEKGVEHFIHANELGISYTPYTPDVIAAMEGIVEMLRSGRITVDEIKLLSLTKE